MAKPYRGEHMNRPNGMHPLAFSNFITACFQAQINPFRRVMQTIGGAKASAGTHFEDGQFFEGGKWKPYTAAVDLRTTDLSLPQIQHLVEALARNHFAAWHRHAGSFKENQHIHAVFAGVKMKPMLQDQMFDWLSDKNGLRGHENNLEYDLPLEIARSTHQMFRAANPFISGALVTKSKEIKRRLA
jgi:hypothetical protein